jgi:hypothetical protein
MKETWKRQTEDSNISTGFIAQERDLWRESPARQLEPSTAYRLGVVLGKLRGKILLVWSESSLREAGGGKWLLCR